MYALVNLDTHTIDKITNEAYHEINDNETNKLWQKDVTTDITDIQNGNRIQGRAYDLANHYNGGHESFGLQLQNLKQLQNLGLIGDTQEVMAKKLGLKPVELQNLSMFGDLTGAISGAA